MFIHLAHILDTNDVAWPGESVLGVSEDRVCGQDGYPFNSYVVSLPNHFGTHMDGPRHFNTTGMDFHELPMEFFGYLGEEVLVMDLPHRCERESLIVPEDLEPFKEELQGKRLLLIRTGFEKYRATDQDLYQNHGPAIHTDFAKALSQDYPDLVCIGMDWMSVASPSNDHGPEAHHWLLGNYSDHIITAIEDMRMADLGDKKIKMVTMGPLRVKGIDSAQVNAMAWVED